MIENILFVQPFGLKKEHLTDEILIWEVYLENYLKSKIPSLKFDILYLPVEQEKGNITISSFKEMELFEKMNIIKTKLANISKAIFVGLQTSADPIYILEMANPSNEGKLIELYSKCLDKQVKIEGDILKPLLKGAEIKRYSSPQWTAA